jgi:hypothetical protein
MRGIGLMAVMLIATALALCSSANAATIEKSERPAAISTACDCGSQCKCIGLCNCDQATRASRAMYEVQCANGQCSTARGFRRKTVTAATTTTTQTVSESSGPARAVGGRVLRVLTAPVRLLRRGCG